MKTFFDAFNEYMTGVLPKDAGKVQRKETIQAFLAGATAFRALAYAASMENNLEVAETKMDLLDDQLTALIEESMNEKFTEA